MTNETTDRTARRFDHNCFDMQKTDLSGNTRNLLLVMTIVFVGRIENVFTGIDNFHNNYSIVILIIAPWSH